MKIEITYNEQEERPSRIRVRRKRKLVDLYPQRALIDEARRNSALGKVNDWIDHEYYQSLVNEAEAKKYKLIKKHSPKKSVVNNTEPMTETKTVPIVENPLFHRIPKS